MSDLKVVSEASITVRRARASLKQRARDGSISVGEVVIGAPAAVAQVRLADIVEWPWPKMGATRQLKVGKLAAREGINLLMPIGKTQPGTRVAFTNIVCEVLGGAAQWESSVIADEAAEEIERLKWLIERREAERDAALRRAEDLERTVSIAQTVMPTLHAERMVADLADAVEVHRRTVTSPKSPPDRWANADEALWQRKNDILAGGPPALQAVA